MRRLLGWSPLFFFLALIALLLGSRWNLVRSTVHQELMRSRARGASRIHPGDGAPAPGDPAQIALGRLLFFDPLLSTNRERACASCHVPARGFSDGNRVALAVDRSPLPRNAPGLTNVSDQVAFFWDGRAASLEEQIDGPVRNRRELGGLSAREIESRLARIPEYRTLFANTYGTRAPRYADAKRAIAEYEGTLRSTESTVDRWWRGEIASSSVPEDVREGFNLFAGKARCSRCHFVPVTTSVIPGDFKEQEFTVIGVPGDPAGRSLDPDPGRYAITHDPADLRAFKAPSLRGIARSAPYMHNGVFQTLDEVVRFYNRGGGRGLGLSVPNQAPEVAPLHLTEREERALVRFLEALSDDPALAEITAPDRVPSGLTPGGKY